MSTSIDIFRVSDIGELRCTKRFVSVTDTEKYAILTAIN